MSATATATVTIARRFRGPTTSGNGGYSCGVLGARLAVPAEVTLRSPPPIEEPLTLITSAERVELRRGDALVADAVPAGREVVVPAPVSVDEAAEASRGYPWFANHPYPECFVCSSERRDGLRILPGAVAGRELAAAPWHTDDSLAAEDGLVRAEHVWAALDCPSWFGFATHRPSPGMILLGRLAARIHERPRAGDTCVAMGWPIAVEGRKIRCGSAVFAADGRLLGAAEATWIVLR